MNHIQIQHGDLLQAQAEVLVNTVNCVGIMGKGIALQFERTFPEIVPPYKEACRTGQLRPGGLLIVPLQPTFERPLPLSIVNFATKDHWRGSSKLEWIELGLTKLVEEVRLRGWQSIALPPLGCGNGGLDWSLVHERITTAFAAVPDVQVLIYPPEGAPDAALMAKSAKAPRMTKLSALYIRLLAHYSIVDLAFSQLEFQKLAYFFQEAGEPLRLHFTAMKYGPSAPEIYPMLRRWEGHWTIGFGDGTGGVLEPVMLHPQIVEEAEIYLQSHPAEESEKHVDRVLTLIEGMDTAAGLELLATIHWIARHNPSAVIDWQVAAQDVHTWNERKQKNFPKEWIQAAWQRLHDHGWMKSLTPISEA